jgi:hypothetical protein
MKKKSQTKDKKFPILTRTTTMKSTKMSTSTLASAVTTFSIVKDKFTEVITKGMLSPTNKPMDWNVVVGNEP